MAIPGISEIRRLPRIAKIRLGEKRKNERGAEYPAKLDHFNLKDAPAVEAIYGKNCKELDIMIPVEDSEIFFSQQLKAYRLTGLFCRSNDGVTASRVRVGQAQEDSNNRKKGDWLDPSGETFIKAQGLDVKIGEVFDLPCPGDDCAFKQNKMCRGIARFMFMIPKVPQFGVFEISTTSFNTIVELNSYIEAIRNAAGRVSMIPLKLRLVPKDVVVNGKKSGIFHLKLEYQGTVAQLREFVATKALPAPHPAAAMPEADPADIPDDLVRSGGADLEEHLGGEVGEPASDSFDPDAARAAAEEPPAEVVPPPPPAAQKPPPAQKPRTLKKI